MSQDDMCCSFCDKNRHQVRKLVAGPNVFICDECIELCVEVVREKGKPILAYTVGNKSCHPSSEHTCSLDGWQEARPCDGHTRPEPVSFLIGTSHVVQHGQ